MTVWSRAMRTGHVHDHDPCGVELFDHLRVAGANNSLMGEGRALVPDESHCADIPSPSLLKSLPKVEGGCSRVTVSSGAIAHPDRRDPDRADEQRDLLLDHHVHHCLELLLRREMED